MFENFPYTDMHQLNLDWIIKIAKDFLEQYTQIQNTITQGLQDLDDKAQNLEQLLQEWYDTHSQDIANQLADALQDLNTWYTQHQGYLEQYLNDSIAAFGTAADQKAAQAIATIPSDYTQLSNTVSFHTKQIFENYRNTGIINPNNIIYSVSLVGTNFTNLNIPTVQNHIYTVLFTPTAVENPRITLDIGSLSGGAWHGKVNVYGDSGFANFTAEQDGSIYFRKTTGSDITIARVYIFDVTNNSYLADFINKYKQAAPFTPYGGMAERLNNKLLEFNGGSVAPNQSFTNIDISTTDFINTNFATESNHTYAVAFTQKESADTLQFGTIAAGAWAGRADVYGNAGIASFTSTDNGIFYIRKTTGSATTLENVQIYDVTNDDILLAFITAHQLDTPNKIYGGLISEQLNTWYYMKNAAFFGDSVTRMGYWIHPVNKNFTFKTIENCGVGGTRISGSDANAMWKDVRINTIPLDSDFITIMGGINDGQAQVQIGDISINNYDTNTFVGAYNVIISKILYKFRQSNGYYPIDYSNITRSENLKNIHILIITSNFCTKSTVVGTDFERINRIINATIEIAKLWGIPVADIYHQAEINRANAAYYLLDEVHPNTEGGIAIAKIITGAMKYSEPIK